jgi:Methyltransferase domain
MTTQKTNLNVGCGRNIREGWINLDSYPLPGVDIVADLERCADVPLALADSSVDEFLLSHVMEHIRNVLPMMQELHRVAKPDAVMKVQVPYGSSDDAFEDPTHVRQMFLGSFGYFSQPYYWRSDYGYRGDWITEDIELVVKQGYAHLSHADVMSHVHYGRNIVIEMIATLRALKPIREPRRELQNMAPVRLRFA